MLIDFNTGSQIHKSHVPGLLASRKETYNYIVGSMQCTFLAREMLEVIRQHGAPGWLGFWEDLVSMQKPRVGYTGNNGKEPVWTPATSVAGSEYGDESA